MENYVQIQVNLDLFKRFSKLGYMGQTPEELLEDVVSHCEICDILAIEEGRR